MIIYHIDMVIPDIDMEYELALMIWEMSVSIWSSSISIWDILSLCLEVLGVGRGRTVREGIHVGLLQNVRHIVQSRGSFGGFTDGRMGSLKGRIY